MEYVWWHGNPGGGGAVPIRVPLQMPISVTIMIAPVSSMGVSHLPTAILPDIKVVVGDI